MAKILRPRRGLHEYATSQNIVLAKGEVFFSYSDNNYGSSASINRIYLGDGSTSFSNLKPFINNSSVDYASTSDYSSKASSATKATRSMASSYVKLNSVSDSNQDYCIGFFNDSPASCYSCYYADDIIINPKKRYISTSTDSATACIAPIGSTYLNTSYSNTTYSTEYYATGINLGISDKNAPTYTANNIIDPTGMASTCTRAGYTYPSYAKINAIDGINLAIYTTRNLIKNNGSTKIVDNGLFLNTSNAYGSTYENVANSNTINHNGSTISSSSNVFNANNSQGSTYIDNNNSDTMTSYRDAYGSTFKYVDTAYPEDSRIMVYNDDDIVRGQSGTTMSTGWNSSSIHGLNDYLNQITPNEYISVHYAHVAVPIRNDSFHLFNTAAATTTFYNNSSYNFGNNITTATRSIPSFTNSSSVATRSVPLIKLNKGFYLISAKIHATGNINANKIFSVGININSTTQFHQQNQYEVVYIGTGAYDGITITHPVYVPNNNSYVWLYGRAEGANFASGGNTHADSNVWISCLRLGGLV